MANEQLSFNLIDEPWIMARTLRGDIVELSLLELFRQASGLQSLANDLPTQDFALLRMLEAILERSIVPKTYDFDRPSELWGALWKHDKLPLEDIEAYLSKWHGRFDLLDEKEPFMQVANMRATNGSVSEIKKLLADCPDGLPLFTLRAGKGVESIGFAEAARWVVHTHAFDTSGIKTGVEGDKGVKGGKSYPIGTGWAGGLGGIYAEGQNLAQTLLLNLCLCADCSLAPDEFLDDEEDLPVWERPQAVPGDSGRGPSGYADLYTWQSRRILLKREGERIVGVVLSNGDRLEYQNMREYEPMTAWRRSSAQEKKLKMPLVYLPYTHQADRSLWRGLSALLPECQSGSDAFAPPGIVLWTGHLSSLNGSRQLQSDYTLRLHATGFVYGVQSATFTELVDDSLTLSAKLLSPEYGDAVDLVRQCLNATDDAVRAYGQFANGLVLASGGDTPLANNARTQAQAEAYYELDRYFRIWLAGLSGSEPDYLRHCEADWHKVARDVLFGLGRRLVDAADDKAIKGRKIKQGNREFWISAGRAESQFIGRVNKILPDTEAEQAESDREG